MKILLPLFLLLCNIQLVFGQITTPIVKANFGIEADLTSNFYNNVSVADGDDWFGNGLPGTGQFIIDTTGAAAIVDGYASDPTTRMMSFARLMRQAPYEVVNNMLLLDAIFQRDHHGIDSTVFAAGSNKNGMTPALWSCPVAQGIPDKNDILDAFTHVRRAGPNTTDSLWMFGGVSIENVTGSRYFDFELYQTDLVYDKATQTFSGYGPDAGHTSWVFDAAGNIVTPGDIIFTAEFNSATISLVEARIWVHQSSLSITPTTFNWGGDFDGDGSGATFGYANILPKTAGEFYTGIQNTLTTSWAGPFALVRVDNKVVTNYIKKQFMEFSVNLTKLGIEPANFSNACGSPFRRVLIKSRASTSFTAELKDFVAPFRMFNYPLVDASAYIQYYCGAIPATATVNVYNPISTFVYNWTTSNGVIQGPTTGPAITIAAPGTYIVTQQLHSQCPGLAVDSITILYDTICAVLKVEITRLNAKKEGKEVSLSWQGNNNELAAYFVIESSSDNRLFKKIGTIPAKDISGKVEYTFRNQLNSNEPVIFYRVRVVGKNGVSKNSNTVLLKPGNDTKKFVSIFPNPAQGEVWLMLESSTLTTVNVHISDITGRAVKSLELPVRQGNNLIPLNALKGQVAGMYLVKVKSIDGESTQKIILKK